MSDDDASSAPTKVVLLMDRFVSASSAQDAMESLQSLVDGYSGKTTDQEQEEPWKSSWIWAHEDLAESLTYLLQHGTLKTDNLP